VDCRATNITPSASSSEVIAFDFVHRCSAGESPNASSESRMNPAEGVISARPTSVAERADRLNAAEAPNDSAPRASVQSTRCCSRTRRSGRNSSMSASRPAKRKSATMPKVASRATVGSCSKSPSAAAPMPRPRLVMADGRR